MYTERHKCTRFHTGGSIYEFTFAFFSKTEREIEEQTRAFRAHPIGRTKEERRNNKNHNKIVKRFICVTGIGLARCFLLLMFYCTLFRDDNFYESIN